MVRRLRCSPRRTLSTVLMLVIVLLILHYHLQDSSTVERSQQQKLPLGNGDSDVRSLYQFHQSSPRPVSLKFDWLGNISQATNFHGHQLHAVRDGLTLRNYTVQTINESVSDVQLEQNFHDYVSLLHASCTDYVRVGNKSDGGWDVCMAGPYRFTQPCLVYSFGIGDNWSFDDDSANKYGCTVRSFDPSINKASHLRGKRVWFYNLGIGKENIIDADFGWEVKTLSALVSMCHDDEKTIDYLKIDVEGNEWGALESMIEDGILVRVKQLAIEIHSREVNNLTSSRADLLRYWTILRYLELLGFRKWYWHFNIWGFFPARDGARYISCCYELVYININFLK